MEDNNIEIIGIGVGGATKYLRYDRLHQTVTDHDGKNPRVMTEQVMGDFLHMAGLLGLDVTRNFRKI